MHFTLSILVFFISSITAQQNVLYIPEVSSMTGEYSQYGGLIGTASSAPQPLPTTKHAQTATCAPYWLANIKHQGRAAFNSNSNYPVFRNVKDYGAKGDGVTDDTAAINRAISESNRCAPGRCQSSTTTPAVVYIPEGTYLISSSIIDYYFTVIIGNPNCLPTLKATPDFTGFGLIDGNQYQPGGRLGYGSTNTFLRQVRNLIIDMTSIPANVTATGIHWPTAQATSLQNMIFKMSDASGTRHTGIFIEEGSAGFMNDLVFYGGLNAMSTGNQQFTMRNLTFYNAVTAINQIWDWGWTYQGITINNCSVGLRMDSGSHSAQNVGSVTLIDSSITNTLIGISTAYDATSQPATAGSLIIENVVLNNVPIAVQGPGNTVALDGTTGTTTITAWGQGHRYQPTGPNVFEGPIRPMNRPTALIRKSGKYYTRSKPQYEKYPLSSFLSVRDAGARGDGVTDDTATLQHVINQAAAGNKIVFFDQGTYKVTYTLDIPPNSKFVGECYSVIMSSGPYFANMKQPKPVIRVGRSGQVGSIEWSDMIVSTQGAQAGAILIEWNLASPVGSPSGMWDVHTRIAGFTGSQLQVAQCPKTPAVKTPPAATDPKCIAAFMSMHVTKSASGLYMENCWIWTADHDLDDASSTQITVYTGRGLYIESTFGTIWLVGTAVEHHALYQYQFANTRNVVMGQIQTETAYYQPNPNASIPFPAVSILNDPVFPKATPGSTLNSADGWSLRILNSQSIHAYGAGLYSFFNNYNTTCSQVGNGETCQTRIFSIEGPRSSDIVVFNLNTIGATNMITRGGKDLASYADNINVFPDTIALFRLKG